MHSCFPNSSLIHTHNSIWFKMVLILSLLIICNHMYILILSVSVQMGEITIKGARGAKVKVFFQGLHITCVIFVLVYNLRICILGTLFVTLHFRHQYILTKNWFYIIYIIHSCPLPHKHGQLLLKTHFQNS
jgi:phosphatidylglycerophosphate synthase